MLDNMAHFCPICSTTRPHSSIETLGNSSIHCDFATIYMISISETPRLGVRHAVCFPKRRNTRHLFRTCAETRQRRISRRCKIGRSWALQEASVYDRLSKKPGAGRPARTTDGAPADKQVPTHDLHSLYLECKRAFQFEPSLQAIEEAETQEEAGFYMAVADYFLQSKQRELIAQGVY